MNVYQGKRKEREREFFYLTTHSTHFIYGYMASDIWLRTILMVRKETRCRHIGYSYRLTARVLLYAPSHRQDNTYHGLCYTSCGALAGTRNVKSFQGVVFHWRKTMGSVWLEPVRNDKTIFEELKSLYTEEHTVTCMSKFNCCVLRLISCRISSIRDPRN